MLASAGGQDQVGLVERVRVVRVRRPCGRRRAASAERRGERRLVAGLDGGLDGGVELVEPVQRVSATSYCPRRGSGRS